MINFRYRYPIAIDLDDGFVSMTQLSIGRSGFEIRGANQMAVQDVEKESDQWVQMVKKAAKTKTYHRKHAVFHLPGNEIVSFPIKFQVGAQETPEAAIVREAEKHLSFPLAEAIIDYPSISAGDGRRGNQRQAVVLAVHRPIIERYSAILKQAGLVVEAVDSRISSLIRVHRYLFNPAKNAVILCHIGYRRSMMAVITDHHMLGQFEFPWGLKPLIDKIGSNLKLSEANEARVLLRTLGFQHGAIEGETDSADLPTDNPQLAISIRRTLHQLLTPYVEDLVNQFQKMIAYVRSEARQLAFDQIYLYGAAQDIRHLDSYVQQQLNIPIRPVDPLREAQFENSSGAPLDTTRGSLILGLAMRRIQWL